MNIHTRVSKAKRGGREGKRRKREKPLRVSNLDIDFIPAGKGYQPQPQAVENTDQVGVIIQSRLFRFLLFRSLPFPFAFITPTTGNAESAK